MRQQILTAVAVALAVALAAAGATTAIATDLPRANIRTPILLAADTAPATAAAAADAKNTKCLVMPDDDVTDGKTATYNGKIYHFCCGICVKKFNKDPQKYLKAFEADPAAYGVK